MEKRFSVMILLVIAAFMLSACAGVAKYNDVFQSSGQNAPNIRTFSATPDNLYSASCRALLADNFRIEKQDTGKSVIAAKYWTEGKKMIQLAIAVNVLPEGTEKATAYASAIQSVNESDVNSNYFHIPIFIGLSVPTPIKTGSTITSAQEEEKTVKNAAFYNRFFKAVERELLKTSDTMSSEDKPSEQTAVETDKKKEETITGTVPRN
ncbi:MAG: DUF2242 domain-containing protein [Nitrospiraceae bacterium]|nr:DUF2242 domain-containing protein [Nitrospiraceae bacterium]